MSAKVLVVTNDFPPRRGGIESFLAALCAGLPSDALVVYTATMPGDLERDAQWSFPVIRDPTGRLLPTRRVADAVRDVVRRHGCDRVVFGAAAPLGLLAGGLRSAGVRRQVALTHGHEVWWAHLPATRSMLRRIGDSVDVVTYVSEFCRREIAGALSGTAAKAMVRLAPGVDVARFTSGGDGSRFRAQAGIAADRPVALAAARLVTRKGHDALVRAWPAVLRRLPDAALLIVGDGPHEGALRRLVTRLRLDAAVSILPGVPWERMPEVYAAADAFALPCRTRRRGLEVEALGIVFLEAAAAGLPVVVGDSGGAPETVVHGRTGYVVEPRDVEQIADRVADLLSSRATAVELGTAGRVRVAADWSTDQAVRTLTGLLS